MGNRQHFCLLCCAHGVACVECDIGAHYLEVIEP